MSDRLITTCGSEIQYKIAKKTNARGFAIENTVENQSKCIEKERKCSLVSWSSS